MGSSDDDQQSFSNAETLVLRLQGLQESSGSGPTLKTTNLAGPYRVLLMSIPFASVSTEAWSRSTEYWGFTGLDCKSSKAFSRLLSLHWAFPGSRSSSSPSLRSQRANCKEAPLWPDFEFVMFRRLQPQGRQKNRNTSNSFTRSQSSCKGSRMATLRCG